MGCSWLLTSQVLKLSKQVARPTLGREGMEGWGQGQLRSPVEAQTRQPPAEWWESYAPKEVHATRVVSPLCYGERLHSGEIALCDDCFLLT